jgi:hypothetical protein
VTHSYYGIEKSVNKGRPVFSDRIVVGFMSYAFSTVNAQG